MDAESVYAHAREVERAIAGDVVYCRDEANELCVYKDIDGDFYIANVSTDAHAYPSMCADVCVCVCVCVGMWWVGVGWRAVVC